MTAVATGRRRLDQGLGLIFGQADLIGVLHSTGATRAKCRADQIVRPFMHYPKGLLIGEPEADNEQLKAELAACHEKELTHASIH